MANFTIPLKSVLGYADIEVAYEPLEYKGQSFGVLPVMKTGVHSAAIGLEAYPLHDEEYRQVLNGKILDRYWNREIGQETPDMFFHALRRWMNENMPYFSQLYSAIPFDRAMLTVDMTTTTHGKSNEQSGTVGESESSSTTVSNALSFNNETPQTAMREDENYATSAVQSDSTTQTTGAGKETGTATTDAVQEGDSTTRGFQGNASALLTDWRASLLNVDVMVLDALAPLFMLVWNNSDTGRNTTEYWRGIL